MRIWGPRDSDRPPFEHLTPMWPTVGEEDAFHHSQRPASPRSFCRSRLHPAIVISLISALRAHNRWVATPFQPRFCGLKGCGNPAQGETLRFVFAPSSCTLKGCRTSPAALQAAGAGGWLAADPGFHPGLGSCGPWTADETTSRKPAGKYESVLEASMAVS